MQRSMMLLSTSLAIAFATPAWTAGGGGGGGAGDSGAGGGDLVGAIAAQDADFQAAMAAVKSQDWQQVIARMGLYAQRNPGSADAFNELGHAYRRSGDMDNAFRNYEIALKIDPRHRGAHEYLGEAYLQIGDLARAERELKALDSLCFLPCEQYTDLKAQIGVYKSMHSKSTT